MLVDGTFLLNIAIESGGLALCILANAFILIGLKADKKTIRFLSLMICSLGAALISNMVGLMLKGNSDTVVFTIVKIANFCEFFFSNTMLFLFGNYLLYRTELYSGKSKAKMLIFAIYILQIALLVSNIFTHIYYYYDESFTYQRGNYFWVSHFVCIISMAFNIIIYMKNRKFFSNKEKYAFFCYITFPMIALIFQTFVYGLFLDLYSAIISVAVLFIFIILDQLDRYLEQQNELAKMKIDVMLSQIQPHFLYNSIGAISELCKQNPEQAREALQNFASYLRGNMDSISCPDFIPFKDELAHIEAYLKLQKMRFGDKINIVYDIEETDFLLPPLTVQPIVENALQHGICKTEEGGTVTLKTQKINDEIIISVIDDGVGFDTALFDKNRKGHIGIDNVQKRLEQTNCGELIINSEKGVGTTAKIIIRAGKQI
ncbi:sensor histidine kinase [Eubacterium sp.]|uniref:sensor histidine kinase n=1 Tax=Eubacterium sp. TaxID=142586 RepID=UPI003F0387BE